MQRRQREEIETEAFAKDGIARPVCGGSLKPEESKTRPFVHKTRASQQRKERRSNQTADLEHRINRKLECAAAKNDGSSVVQFVAACAPER